MNDKTTIVSHGITFTGALTIVFIVLKILKIISWSWVWVMCPLWIPVFLYALGFILYCIARLISEAWFRKQNKQNARE